MTFKSSSSDDFDDLSKKIYDKIKSFDGCLHLEIYRDIHSPDVFFSYSHWTSEEHLNEYRNSKFFIAVWSKTKEWFSERPVAWSVTKVI